MYLERLSLKNFKCFPDQELSLSKITLLLGANSTGKSSLLHSLLAALQSDQFPLAFSANGTLVNLGDFRALSHRHRTDHHITVGLRFGGHQLGTVTFEGTFAESARTGMPELYSAECGDPTFIVRVRKGDRYRADWTYDSGADPLIKRFHESADARKIFQALARFLEEARGGSEELQAKGLFPEELFATPPPTGNFSFATPGEFFQRVADPLYFLLTPHLAALSTTISEFQKTFNYVGSFRQEPRRSYFQVSKGDIRVRRDGQNCIEQISDWQEKKAPQLLQLREALRRLNLLTALRTSRLRSGIFEVKVRTGSKGVPVSLADVGFGIGQVLPILVADLQLPKGGTLAIAQPEIHLHPSAQADLAEHFVRRALTARNRYIIETHSEYFLNRLRFLVTKKRISPSDLSVVYLTSDGSRSAAHNIVFTADGRIEGAPDDFFRTYMVDVMNIAMNAKPS